MSPRTNDSAPESGRGDRPEAEPPRPTLRAAETTPEEGAASAVEGGTSVAESGENTVSETPDAPHGDGPSATGPTAGTEADGRQAQERADRAQTVDERDAGTDPSPRPAGDADAVRGPVSGEESPREPGGAPKGADTPASCATSRGAAGDADADAASDADAAAARVAVTTPSPEPTGSPAAVDASAATEATSREGTDSDERVVALRRFSASGRRWRAVQLGLCAASLAVALTAGAAVIGALRDSGGTAPVASAPSGVSPELLASGDLDSSIRALQAHLRAQPRDYGSWATLGLAYVEQARTKGDPSRYPQAQRALDQSLKLRPDNDAALAGRAALAAARHDFSGALKYADLTLKQNPYSERALSSRIDALVELGRYEDASKAADLADSRHPGVPVFTRYAYVHELRGDVQTARRVLEQALSTATSRGDIAYVAAALGQLAWNQGDYKTALDHYARALAADENYLPALEGRARAQAAQGDTADAIRGMEQVVERYPLPQPLVELGELYEVRGKAGDLDKARDQYALVDAWVSLARANGVNADLDTALAAADHGDRTAALKAARAEWARRHTVHTADALAWALHVNGRDQEALPYARQATATGYRNASFLYHRGMIERATGHTEEARASLTSALKLNAGFSPLGARAARKALEAMQ
ncbi:tetratricopeptide repeat protein [Streptomyces sp. NPDC001795]|uniref:tetratricopeptide repeat protein n=1 Tax=Streptomyces sp. NPDC001795 TaxID=3154525 RepID=UPI003316E2B5